MNLRHPKAREVIRSGIFKRVNSFQELERRIRRIQGRNARNRKGYIFEVFAEAALLSLPEIQAKSVWGPVATAPQAILTKLNLRSTDKGVDGIVETNDGRLITYQAKFRSGRPKLTWSLLGNFYGLSRASQLDNTLIFTNCDDFEDEVKDQDSMVISGNYLDQLESKHLQRALALLTAKPRPKVELRPDPHQERAIADSVQHFERNDRGQYISACGTGKTFTSFWIGQALRANTILYLVPSLALVKQTIGEWLKLSEAPFPFLSVCSDIKTARKGDTDELVITQSDLPFAVTTRPEQINDWVKATENFDFRVVFATYDSAKAVAAGVGDEFCFDLGFFDEAHKTAGRAGTKYNFALDESKISITKRLFMTATPRFVKARTKREDGELTTALSMDNAAIYGERYHNFSFYEARTAGVIVPFKVHVSTITSDEVNEYARKRSSTEIDGDPIRSEQVARQLALSKAQADTGARKILTFHQKINHAESFASNKSEGIGSHLPDFLTCSVRGSQNVSVRDGILREFAQSDKGLVSNARCLTEGVDVPEIDLIFFSAPKRSVVDIAQAVGRAVRKPRCSSEKQAGYVVVPLFREQEESTADATLRTGFQDIADVINALQAHDSELAETLQRMRVKKPKIGGYDPKDLEDYLAITGDIELEALSEAIVTEVVDSLTPTWDEWYGLLEMHLEEYGEPPGVPKKIKGKKKTWQLGGWCSQQRTLFNKGQLSESRIERLNLLIPSGWMWNPVADRLIRNAKNIRDWCVQNKQWHVNASASAEMQLAYTGIHTSYTNNALPDEAIEILEAIPGWIWRGVDEKVWNLKFNWYRDWCVRTNRILPERDEITVSDIYGVEEFNLRGWLDQQGQKYFGIGIKKRLLREQVSRFEEEIPYWAWTSWEMMFKAYTACLERFGKTFTGQKTLDYDFLPVELRSVPRWVSKQRGHYNSNAFFISSALKPDFQFQLEESGFDFAPFEKIWHRRYMLLREQLFRAPTTKFPEPSSRKNVVSFWPKQNQLSASIDDMTVVRIRQDEIKDSITLGIWITQQRTDIKLIPATPEAAFRERLLAQIPGWHRSPADYRTVKYEDATAEQITKLWRGVAGDEELETFFLYALYAGLRQNELSTAVVVNERRRSFIEIPNVRGSASFRRVPLHPKLRARPLRFMSSRAAISARFAKRKDRSLGPETHVTSLNYALYAALIQNGIDCVDLVALTHGKEEAFWDVAVMDRLAVLFKQIDFGY